MTWRLPIWAFVFLAALAPARPAVALQAHNLLLQYVIYAGGLHVLSTDFRISLDPQHYRLETAFRTDGLVGLLFPWSLIARSQGAIDSDGVRPSDYRSTNVWRGRERWVEVVYGEDGAITVRAEPPANRDHRDAVPEALKGDTVDLLSGALSLGLVLAAGGSCDWTVPVFDGRRRYDLVFEDIGTQRVDPSRYSVFSGDAVACRVHMERLAGFSNRDGRQRMEGALSSASVWIAPVFSDTLAVPVRLEAVTPYGAVRAHLGAAKLQEAPPAR